MEDAELVLKELRIDWETILTEDYNPLKQALEIKRSSIKHSNYRNIYHRVEKVMEKIIEETYKGFSDSVLSYMECYNLTANGLKDINEMIDIVKRLRNIKINTEDIYKNFKDTEYLKIKNSLCEDLVEIKNRHEDFKRLYKEGSILEACINIQEVRDKIKNKHLYHIKGIDTYDLEVEADVKEVCLNVFSKLDLFIYQDAIEYKEYFRIIVVLNRILKYDRYVYTNLEKNIFNCIEDIIFKVNKGDVGVWEDDRTEETVDYDVSKEEGVLINSTVQTPTKIYCFYKTKPMVDSKPEKNLKNILVKQIVSKIQTIKHNISYLRRLADSAFENLDEQSKNYYGEYSGFMIFCSTGEENIERIVQKVINRFIDVYTDNEKKDIDVGEFENINILDNINYGEEFDEKYPIYNRIMNNKSIDEEKEEDFTLIFRPSIDICIDLYEHIREENIKQRCMRYIEQKGEDVLRKMLLVFQERRWDRNNYSTNTIWFLEAFLKILRDVENIVRVFGVSSLDSSFRLISRKMEEKYLSYFKNSTISECFSKSIKISKVLVVTDRGQLNVVDLYSKTFQDTNLKDNFKINLKTMQGIEITDASEYADFAKVEEGATFKYFINFPEDVKATLKKFVVSSSINNKELIFSKTKYEHVLFSINTLLELSLIELAYKYTFSFKISIILEIIYYFDIYYREGIFNNSFYIKEINKIVQEVYSFIDISDIFEIIDYYVINNRKRLNVREERDLMDFCDGLKLLDESLSDISEKHCLKRSISYIEEELKNIKRK
ncbi:hypothetical protein NGRA_0651 [Nosema granulosis]|uniref:Exocyst complex component Sec8 N-terminal domain-containing protein n=1 Tax=Nosema granulosis TaxID=83296 RepID=A0A9P6H107_9MICR|nr:hypothetical protein NGRA_0651 [Nosema granulosis]